MKKNCSTTLHVSHFLLRLKFKFHPRCPPFLFVFCGIMMMGNREVTELWKSEGAGISTKRNHGYAFLTLFISYFVIYYCYYECWLLNFLSFMILIYTIPFKYKCLIKCTNWKKFTSAFRLSSMLDQILLASIQWDVDLYRNVFNN